MGKLPHGAGSCNETGWGLVNPHSSEQIRWLIGLPRVGFCKLSKALQAFGVGGTEVLIFQDATAVLSHS